MGSRVARRGRWVRSRRVFEAVVTTSLFSLVVAPWARAETLLLLGGGDQLALLDTGNPAFPFGQVAVTGLEDDEALVDLAVRPLTGQVYGISRTSSGDRGRLYVIEPSTGVATAVGTELLAIDVIQRTLISFDPVTDRLRVLSSSVNVLLDPDTADVTETGTPPHPEVLVSGLAYSHGTPDAVDTTLYAAHDLDGSIHHWFGTIDPPSSGTIASSDIFAPWEGAARGLDTSPTRDVAYVMGFEGAGAVSFLYEIDLATRSVVTSRLAVGGSPFVVLTRPELLWALTADNTLVRFSTSDPATVLSTVTVTGVEPDEELLAIDFRRSNGELYGLGSSSRLYVIDTASGAATPVGEETFAVPLNGTEFGMDFAAELADSEVRLSSDLGQNMRVDSNTGDVIDGDGQTDGIQPDGDFQYGVPTNVPGLAYTSRLPRDRPRPAPQVQLFALSSLRPAPQSRFDTVCPVPVPLTGELPIACASGIVGLFPDDAPNAVGFDASPRTPDAYLAFSDDEGTARLYTLSLSREPGMSLLGEIGTDLPIRGVAVEQPGRPELDAELSPVTEDVGDALITVHRRGGSAGFLAVRFEAFSGIATSTAHPGTDFTPVSDWLLFVDGETSKTFPVPILDDTDAEAEETFRLRVSAPGVHENLLSIPLTILDDDRVPGSPEISITTPESPVASFWSRSIISLAGTAADDVDVAEVTWETTRGDAGVANGTTDWTIPFIPLQAGDTVITVAAVDADGHRTTTSVLVTLDSLGYALAEGATSSFFTTDLLLANPNSAPAPVEITFLKTDGSTITQTLTLPETSRETIVVNEIPGLETAEFSITVDSLDVLPLVVERTMRWDATGYGAHTEQAQGTSLQWYFAEGAQGFELFDTFLLLANSSASTNEATVQFLREGAPPITSTYTMAPMSRTTIYAGHIPELVDQIFGMNVTFEDSGVAERAMYFGTPVFEGGHISAGVRAPAQTWFHAEGATAPFFNTFLLVANPNDQEASVTLRFLPASGEPVIRAKTIPPHGRLTVDVGAEDVSLASTVVATEVASNVPVVSERAMYWPGGAATWYEAHASAGVEGAWTRWGLAEGRIGGPENYQTFILLANPGETAAQVTVTFLPTGDAPIERTYTVAPASRFTVSVASDVPELADQEFGAVISSDEPLVVERALYSDANGVTWAAGTNAIAAPLP
ncbi:MAG: DUF4394 domain-containing protein [Luteitalea sp.]|nr:DUF4394 domain-containing protein [Luteitalea sp.]